MMLDVTASAMTGYDMRQMPPAHAVERHEVLAAGELRFHFSYGDWFRRRPIGRCGSALCWLMIVGRHAMAAGSAGSFCADDYCCRVTARFAAQPSPEEARIRRPTVKMFEHSGWKHRRSRLPRRV